MSKIFISYRREDSQWPARTLRDALARYVANPDTDIFMDIDNIPLGVNFAGHIDKQIAQCDLVLALIGPKWTGATDAQGHRRLDDPQDFVRLEIAHALKRGIPVVPVLLDDARMPTPSELPDDLRELAMRNATQVRHATFNADAQRLISGLNLTATPAPKAAASKPRQTQKQSGGGGLVAVGFLVLLLGGGIGGYFAMGDPLHLLNRAPTEPEAAAQTAASTLPTAPGPNVAQIGPPPASPIQSNPAAGPPPIDPSQMVPPSPAKGMPAPAPVATPAVNGQNVKLVRFNGNKARLAQTGDKQWTEYGSDNGFEMGRFTETMRDDWSVYLTDGAGKKLQIDIYRKMIGLSIGDAKMADWQKIDEASATLN
jgi:hypothetical protein